MDCPRCECPFDTIMRMPRMLTTCGHTICSACLADLGTRHLNYTCPDDGKVTLTRKHPSP